MHPVDSRLFRLTWGMMGLAPLRWDQLVLNAPAQISS